MRGPLVRARAVGAAAPADERARVRQQPRTPVRVHDARHLARELVHDAARDGRLAGAVGAGDENDQTARVRAHTRVSSSLRTGGASTHCACSPPLTE